MKITKKITLKELAFLVCGILKESGIDAVLTGGAVVSIYSDCKYRSYDLDFITHSKIKDVERVLSGAGFYKDGRYFKHPETQYFLDFPAPPVSIGNKPATKFAEIYSDIGYLKLLTPTQCVMDRLAAFYFWNDMPALEQALMVADSNEVNLLEIKKWSDEEGMSDKFNLFADRLDKSEITL